MNIDKAIKILEETITYNLADNLTPYGEAKKILIAYARRKIVGIEEIRKAIQKITEKHFAPITIGYRKDLAQEIYNLILIGKDK